jgi:hypothetical protein
MHKERKKPSARSAAPEILNATLEFATMMFLDKECIALSKAT